jgi:hypothetical protein
MFAFTLNACLYLKCMFSSFLYVCINFKCFFADDAREIAKLTAARLKGQMKEVGT